MCYIDNDAYEGGINIAANKARRNESKYRHIALSGNNGVLRAKAHSAAHGVNVRLYHGAA